MLSHEVITALLDDSVAALLGRIRARFLAKVDPDGQGWIPSHAGQLREAAGGPGTLFDTGNLFHSIQEAVPPNDQARVIATDVEYAPFLQFGYTLTTKNGITTIVPPRVFLGIGDEDQGVIDAIVQHMIEEALNA